MWLVLCHATDAAAIWAYHGLMNRGLSPLELVSAETLAFSLHWEHRVNSDGASFRITMADGRQIVSEGISGAINRIEFAPVPHWNWASPGEQEYVQQEMTALYTSWLHALPGTVMNRATARGLSTSWRRPAEWNRLATEAGLSTSGYQSWVTAQPTSSNERLVFVVDGIVLPDNPVAEGCRRLACLSEIPLLGISFEVERDGTWRFTHATGAPDLRLGGTALLNVLKSRLEAGKP
jgi:hypothetical protein